MEETIKSPVPGTFYRRSSPEAEPYVTEGDRVKPGDVVGLVELMKSFHDVKSESEGVVGRFLVENEDLVEAGQDLIVLDG
jgi:acetyl-CoA carboxylase biotin carboxyl carrier protein